MKELFSIQTAFIFQVLVGFPIGYYGKRANWPFYKVALVAYFVGMGIGIIFWIARANL